MFPKKINNILVILAPTIFFFLGGLFYYNVQNYDIIVNLFNHDDSFYYYKTAEIFSRSGLSSFDYQTSTNGYHPLWFLVLTVVYFLLDITGGDFLDLYIIFALQIVLVMGTVNLIFFKILNVTANTEGHFIAGLVVAILLPSIVNGMETALVIFLIAIWLYLFLKSGGRYYLLAIVSSLVFLSRLDVIIIFSPIIICAVVFDKSNRKGALISSVSVFLTLLLYTVVNVVFFDAAQPISGVIKSIWGELQRSTLTLSQYSLIFAKVLLANIGNVSLYSFSAFGNPDFGIPYNKYVFAISFIFTSIVLISGILVLVEFHSPLIKLYMVASFGGIILFVLYHSFRGYFDKSFAWYNYFIVFLFLFSFGLIARFITENNSQKIFLKISLTLCVILTSQSIVFNYLPFGYQAEYARVADRIREYVRSESLYRPVVAGWSVGQLGYNLNDLSVINLEGLISNSDFLEATKTRELKSVVCKYNIDIIAQHFPGLGLQQEKGISGWLVKLRTDQLDSIQNGLSIIWYERFIYGVSYIFRVDRAKLGC